MISEFTYSNFSSELFDVSTSGANLKTDNIILVPREKQALCELGDGDLHLTTNLSDVYVFLEGEDASCKNSLHSGC